MGANLNLSEGFLTIDTAGVSVAVETLESTYIAISIVPQNNNEPALLTLERNHQVLETAQTNWPLFRSKTQRSTEIDRKTAT